MVPNLLIHTRVRAACFVALAVLSGCGGMSADEPISDAEIDQQAVSAELVQIGEAPRTSPEMRAAKVRVTWGFLAGKARPDHLDWSGALTVERGTLSLERLLNFGGHDRLLTSDSEASIRWRSRGAIIEGFLAEVVAPLDGVVRFETKPLRFEVSMAELVEGVQRHFVVDSELHEVSLASIPAGPGTCGGFASGFGKPAADGINFGGLLTDGSGKILGRLRFRAVHGKVTGTVFSRAGELLAEGEGTLPEERGDTFTLALTAPDGRPYANVKGSYQRPAYSERGWFQATYRCTQRP